MNAKSPLARAIKAGVSGKFECAFAEGSKLGGHVFSSEREFRIAVGVALEAEGMRPVDIVARLLPQRIELGWTHANGPMRAYFARGARGQP